MPQNQYELSLPQGFLHCLLDHQALLAPGPQVPGLTGHRGWLQEEEDEDRGKANLQKYSKALPKNLPCSCRSNWKKYFGGNESIKKPMKGTLPVFADTFSKIALEVEPTLNISLLFFVQRYV